MLAAPRLRRQKPYLEISLNQLMQKPRARISLAIDFDLLYTACSLLISREVIRLNTIHLPKLVLTKAIAKPSKGVLTETRYDKFIIVRADTLRDTIQSVL